MITGKNHYRELTKFILVGLLNTSLGYGLFTLLIYIKINYLVALTLSHIIATCHSYIWNRYFTFKSRNKIKKEIFKFFLIYAIIYIMNFTILYLSVHFLNFKPLISQLFILAAITTISFIGQRFYTFKPSSTSLQNN